MENDSGGSSEPAAASAMMEDRQMQDEPMEAGTGAADSMEAAAAGVGQEVPSAAGVVFAGLTNETAGTSGAAQMVAVNVLEAANTTAGRQDLRTDAGGVAGEAGAVSLAAGGAEVEDSIDGRQELGAVALQDDMQAEFNLNPDDFPALERPSSPVGSVDDSDNDDDNMDEPNDSDPEEAMDDALENFDDDDEEDDDMDDAMLENGVPFIHVFSPRQQLDSDNDNNTDDEDSQQLEQFDISLPGQHLYIPADEAADEPIDPPPALPLLPPPPPDEDPPPPTPEQHAHTPSGDVVFSIFEEPQPAAAGGGAPHCPPLPVSTVRVPVLEHSRQHNCLMVLPGMKVPLLITTPRDRAVVGAAGRCPLKAFVCLDLRQAGRHVGCLLQVLRAREYLGSLHVLARATQRYRLQEVHREVSGVVVAEVELLQEVLVTAPLGSVRLTALDRHLEPSSRQLLELRHAAPQSGGAAPHLEKQGPRLPTDYIYPDARKFQCSCGSRDQDPVAHRDRHRRSLLRKRAQCARYTSVLTQVPSWVLQRTDVYRLAASVRQYLLVLGSEAAQVPESPVSLCEYACLNVPLPDHHRRYLLHLHCYHQRLMYLLHLQEQWTSLGCVHCEALVARREDLLIVSSDGQQSAYVNPGGFVHEIITVRTTDRLYLLGAPTPEHSWFPGYAWTIATCSGCRRHVGWKFTAVRPNLRPKKFYGLTRTAVMPV